MLGQHWSWKSSLIAITNQLGIGQPVIEIDFRALGLELQLEECPSC